MAKTRFWLRWSWRDLRERWPQVLAIALIVALGIGIYAGMGTTTPWRLNSADESYSRLNMFDLRVKLTKGSYVNRDDLIEAIRQIEHAAWIEQLEARLIESTYVNVQTNEGENLFSGLLIGLDVQQADEHINGLSVETGRALRPDDAGKPVGILEYNFAQYYHLSPQGKIGLSGDLDFEYVGTGLTPDYFIVTTDTGGTMAQAQFVAIFAPLDTVQQINDRPGMVNDLLLTLTPGADENVIRAEIEAAFRETFPGVGLSLIEQQDDLVRGLVYDTARMNQGVYDIIITMFLVGALFGAFNLTNRIVEAQRRQIGIGMALGVSPRSLAIRPLLMGGQIAVLGTILGLVMALLVAQVGSDWMKGVVPMPVYARLLDTGTFIEAALLGLILPFVASIYPVWRAMRVIPVDAIRTGHLVAKSNGIVASIKHVPGKSFVQMPVRNLLRAPRRTLLTALGITAAITILVMMIGALDTLRHTVDVIRQESQQDHPNRMVAYLNGFYPINSEQVSAIAKPSISTMTEPALVLPGSLKHNGKTVDTLVELIDLDNDLWTPTITKGHTTSDTPGVVIAQKAAADLGVEPGDTIQLEHPHREGLFGYNMVTSEVEVLAIHANPVRVFVYMDIDHANLMGLSGTANIVHLDPVMSQPETKKVLFQQGSITGVVSMIDAVDSTQTFLKEVIKFLTGVELGVFALAFLIAFNSTNINLSERAREIATMFAFGLPIRTAARMAMLENFITGLLGTLVGVVAGWLLMIWLFRYQIEMMMPDFSFAISVSPVTILFAALAGIGIVTITPIFTVRKMARMNIPDTLRVME
jgi:putative ABC transport system permease protein